MSYVSHRPRIGLILALSALTLLAGLGGSSSTRLSYHEAIVAQGAREMLASGDWLVPTINHQPWVEKPPLAHWLTAIASLPGQRVSEFTTRLPSASAAVGLSLAIAIFASRRYGSKIGTLAGLIQVTTYWTVLRGRLADADILLAALVTVCLVVFETLRGIPKDRNDSISRWWTILFYGLLGSTSLAKGIGFGAVLVLSVVVTVLFWDRDRVLFRRLLNPPGIALAGLIALAWPLMLVARYPEALTLWTLHISDRLADRPAHFASGPWWSYLVAVVTQSMPWTPVAFLGLFVSLKQIRWLPQATNRLLITWAVVPLVLLSFATVKNAHYAIYALPPWSVWAALGLVRMQERWENRGWSSARWRLMVGTAFCLLGVCFSLMFGWVAARLDSRGREWSFYQQIADCLSEGDTLVFVHDDWDRLPYATPFGVVPHDLAVRLFYLNRADLALSDVSTPQRLAEHPPMRQVFSIIARERDLETLSRLGRLEPIAVGPQNRWDRRFSLYRVERTEASRVADRSLLDPRR